MPAGDAQAAHRRAARQRAQLGVAREVAGEDGPVRSIQAALAGPRPRHGRFELRSSFRSRSALLLRSLPRRTTSRGDGFIRVDDRFRRWLVARRGGRGETRARRGGRVRDQPSIDIPATALERRVSPPRPAVFIEQWSRLHMCGSLAWAPPQERIQLRSVALGCTQSGGSGKFGDTAPATPSDSFASGALGA